MRLGVREFFVDQLHLFSIGAKLEIGLEMESGREGIVQAILLENCQLEMREGIGRLDESQSVEEIGGLLKIASLLGG